MQLSNSEFDEQRTLAHNDEGVQLVVPAGTTGTTTAAVVVVDDE